MSVEIKCKFVRSSWGLPLGGQTNHPPLHIAVQVTSQYIRDLWDRQMQN